MIFLANKIDNGLDLSLSSFDARDHLEVIWSEVGNGGALAGDLFILEIFPVNTNCRNLTAPEKKQYLS